jgi:hypothetical protein
MKTLPTSSHTTPEANVAVMAVLKQYWDHAEQSHDLNYEEPASKSH